MVAIPYQFEVACVTITNWHVSIFRQDEHQGMARKFLAFDIETAADIPGPDFNWKPHRPIGITCAAAIETDGTQAVVWHGQTADGKPAPRMSPRTKRSVSSNISPARSRTASQF